MSKKLSILSIVVVLLFSICLVGCGSDFLKGNWKFYATVKDGKEKEMDEKVWFNFKDDNQVEYTEGKKTKVFYYIYDDDTVYMSETKGEEKTKSTMTMKIKSHSSDKMNVVVSIDPDEEFVFKKE